jgi:hypothetical protein
MRQGSRIFEALFLLMMASTVYCLTIRGFTYRLLTEEQMRNQVRGAVPANCTTQFLSGNCTDYLAFCASMSPDDCKKNPSCTGCTNANNFEQACRTSKPWNALTCTPQQSVPGGCGTFLTASTCAYDLVKGCYCSGQAGPDSCSQVQATSTGVGSCTIVK